MLRLTGVAIALCVFGTPAFAEPQLLDIESAADWVHEPTGLRLPPTIRDFVRDRIASYAAGDSNIGSSYFSPDDDEVLSVYVYRSGSYDVSMMADAAIEAMFTNENLGTIDAESVLFATFGAADIGEQSGVRASFEVDGPYRSTGLALFRAGNWLIKLRLSSKRVDVQSLDGRLALLASGMPISEPPEKAPPAYRILDCNDAQERPVAPRRTLEMTDWVIATMAVSVAYDESIDEDMPSETQQGPAPSKLCRDRASQAGRMFYRDGDSKMPRAIVFGDSGTVSYVGQMGFSLSEGEEPPIILSLANGMRTQLYEGFDMVPGFDQMLSVLSNEPTRAVVERTEDGGTNIILPSDS